MSLAKGTFAAAALALTLGGGWGFSQGRSPSSTPVASFYGLEGNDWPFDTSETRDSRRIDLVAFVGDPATLRKVRIVHRHHISYTARVENLHPRFRFVTAAPGINPLNGQPWGFDFPAWLFAKDEAGWLVMFTELPFYAVHPPASVTLEAYDGVLDFAGPSGESFSSAWDTSLQPTYWTTRTTELTHPTYLATFCDPDGVVTLDWHSIAYARIEGPWGDATLREHFSIFWDFEVLSVEYVTQ